MSKADPRRSGFREVLATAYRQMARKRRKGGADPNDRDYDPAIHRTLRRLDPFAEHEMLEGDEEDR